MCKMFKNFFIHLLLLPHTFTFPVNRNDVAPNIDEAAVQKEIAPVLEKLENFLNTDDNYTRIMRKGEFLGELNMIAQRAVKADLLLINQGHLEHEKEQSDLYRVLLGISHRVDTLEQILSCDSNVQLSGARDVRWKKILNLETQIVQQFRSKIIAAGLTVELFAKAIQKICQERNDRAGHGDVSLPEEIKDDNVEQILTKMKIPKDDFYKRTIQLLISPLTLPATTLPK